MQETDPSNTGARAAGGAYNALRALAAGCLVGLSSVVSAISFVAIVYADTLAVYLDRGIGLILIGGAVAAAIGALLFTYKGTVNHAQDVTAILMASGAASIAASGLEGDVLFATVATFTIISSVLAGVASLAMGHLGLSYLVRFIPYPMLGGFLAATGYLLLLGSISVSAGIQVDLWSFGAALPPEVAITWFPWLVGGMLVVFLTRRVRGEAVLPACIVASLIVFYSVLWLRGLTLSEAAERGLLLGPFSGGGFLTGISPGFPFAADYGAILGHVPSMIAIVAMTILGGLLNTQGLAHVTGCDSKSDDDLKAIGWGNVVGGGLGGLVSYPALGDSIIAYKTGLRGIGAGLSVTLFSLLILLIGIDVLAVLPKGVFGLILAYLGFELLYAWFWRERSRLPWRDFAVVLIVLGTAATVGFLAAIALGFVLSMLLFIIAYARIDPVRHQATLATRRSMVERGPADRAALTRLGDQVMVIELTGYLFFGTATELRERLVAAVTARRKTPRAIAVDFRRVPDIDASAISALVRMTEYARDEGIAIVFAGLPAIAEERLRRFADEIRPKAMPEYCDTLEEALQALEWIVLEEDPTRSDEGDGFLETLQVACPELDVRAYLPSEAVQDGAEFVTQGDEGRDMFVLLEGAARAVVTRKGADPIVVARFLPGAVVGEMAFYGKAARTASVIAEGDVRVLRIRADALSGTGDYPETLRLAIHETVAGYMSRRLGRVTRLLHQSLS